MQTLMPPPRSSSSARTEQRAVVVAPVPRRPAGWGGENTPSTTLGRAVGQQVPRRQGDTSAEVALPPARWKRALVIAGTGAVVAGGALAVLLWPQEGTGGSISGGGGVGGGVGVAGTQPTAPMAKLLISVDVTATANVDGVGATPCLPGQATEIPIRAGAPHDVKVFTADGKVKHFNVPSLEPGAIQPMNVHLGVVPAAK